MKRFALLFVLFSLIVGGWAQSSNNTYRGNLDDLVFCDGDVYENDIQCRCSRLTYVRSFSSSTWQAFYVPFSIPVSMLAELGFQLAELNGTHQYYDPKTGKLLKTEIEFRYIVDGNTEPNYPYLIKADAPVNAEIVLSDVILYPATDTEIECSTTRQVFKIKGSYAGVLGSVMYGENYYAMGGGRLIRAQDNSTALKPQRWYMEIQNKNGSAVDYFAPQMRVLIEGEAFEQFETGIKGVLPPVKDSDDVYDILGRHVKGAALRDGIYIKNSKKMILR